MKLTITIPVFNEPRIARALDSILAQRLPAAVALELVVVDATSTDATPDVLARYADRIDTLVSEPDEGIYDGMNKGVALATGDVVGILSANDRYADDHALAAVAAAFAASEVDACYGDLEYRTDDGRLVRRWRAGEHGRAKWRLGWMPPHPTFFVRRAVYQRLGAYDLRYPIAADYELMLRFMFKHNIRARYLPRTLVAMSPGGTSNASLGAVARANIEVARAWRNNGLGGWQLAPILKPARKIPQFAARLTGQP